MAGERAWSVYCEGPLLEAVQASGLFADCKTFVDMPMIKDPEEILADFMGLSPAQRADVAVLEAFVGTRFAPAGSDMEPFAPPDFRPSPPGVDAIEDPQKRDWARAVHSIWPRLVHRVSARVRAHPHRHSALWRRFPVVVPGGRFRESYYWDSFWIVRGLLASGMEDTASGVVNNLLDDVERFGMVPNGGRVYYARRSQPPLLSDMVCDVYAQKRDVRFLRRAAPLLEREYAFWMDPTRCRAVRVFLPVGDDACTACRSQSRGGGGGGKADEEASSHGDQQPTCSICCCRRCRCRCPFLNRYWGWNGRGNVPSPRPESFREDRATAISAAAVAAAAAAAATATATSSSSSTQTPSAATREQLPPPDGKGDQGAGGEPSAPAPASCPSRGEGGARAGAAVPPGGGQRGASYRELMAAAESGWDFSSRWAPKGGARSGAADGSVGVVAAPGGRNVPRENTSHSRDTFNEPVRGCGGGGGPGAPGCAAAAALAVGVGGGSGGGCGGGGGGGGGGGADGASRFRLEDTTTTGVLPADLNAFLHRYELNLARVHQALADDARGRHAPPRRTSGAPLSPSPAGAAATGAPAPPTGEATTTRGDAESDAAAETPLGRTEATAIPEAVTGWGAGAAAAAATATAVATAAAAGPGNLTAQGRPVGGEGGSDGLDGTSRQTREQIPLGNGGGGGGGGGGGSVVRGPRLPEVGELQRLIVLTGAAAAAAAAAGTSGKHLPHGGGDCDCDCHSPAVETGTGTGAPLPPPLDEGTGLTAVAGAAPPAVAPLPGAEGAAAPGPAPGHQHPMLCPEAMKYGGLAWDRALAMDTHMWDGERGMWRDCWLLDGRGRDSESPHATGSGATSEPSPHVTAACFVPLWGGLLWPAPHDDFTSSGGCIDGHDICTGSGGGGGGREANGTSTGGGVVPAHTTAAGGVDESGSGSDDDGPEAWRLRRRRRRASVGERLLAAVRGLRASGLLRPGGVQASTQLTGQQWDAPNAWPPLQWLLAQGLRQAAAAVTQTTAPPGAGPGREDVEEEGEEAEGSRGGSGSSDGRQALAAAPAAAAAAAAAEALELAREVEDRCLSSMMEGWQRDAVMHEKYDAGAREGQGGAGGEYEPQVGFGWTNGVALDLLLGQRV